MNERSCLKSKADTYYFTVSKIALFITALFSIGILYLAYSMGSSPTLALKYYFEIPAMIKNVLAVCIAAAAAGAVLEAGTN